MPWWRRRQKATIATILAPSPPPRYRRLVPYLKQTLTCISSFRGREVHCSSSHLPTFSRRTNQAVLVCVYSSTPPRVATTHRTLSPPRCIKTPYQERHGIHERASRYETVLQDMRTWPLSPKTYEVFPQGRRRTSSTKSSTSTSL